VHVALALVRIADPPACKATLHRAAHNLVEARASDDRAVGAQADQQFSASY